MPLDAYAGKAVKFRLHYLTDGGVSKGGFFGDDLTIPTRPAPGKFAPRAPFRFRNRPSTPRV